MSNVNLFEKYGGFSKISKVVLAFYNKVLDSDEIGPFFDEVDMSKMVDHQTKFVASLLGGPASYTDIQLRNLHAHLTVTDAQFDELKDILGETLLEQGFEDEDIKTVANAFEVRRNHILGKNNVN